MDLIVSGFREAARLLAGGDAEIFARTTSSLIRSVVSASLIRRF